MYLSAKSEANFRASTVNIAGIGGFGMAVELAGTDLEENSQHISQLETHFLNKLDKKEIDYRINGTHRVPGVLNLTFPNMDGQNLVMQLDMAGIGISFGAACASGTVKTSSMLLDMGLTEDEALSTVRISFGKIHTHEDVQTVIDAIGHIVNQNTEMKTTCAG